MKYLKLGMKFEKTEFRHMAFCDEIRKFGFKICLFGVNKVRNQSIVL